MKKLGLIESIKRSKLRRGLENIELTKNTPDQVVEDVFDKYNVDLDELASRDSRYILFDTYRTQEEGMDELFSGLKFRLEVSTNPDSVNYKKSRKYDSMFDSHINETLTVDTDKWNIVIVRSHVFVNSGRKGYHESDSITVNKKEVSSIRVIDNEVDLDNSETSVKCECGEVVNLWFNGGELDERQCNCGRRYSLVFDKISLLVDESEVRSESNG